MIQPPVYTDGYFDLYRIKEIAEEENPDYPIEKLINQNLRVWYNELSVYDHTKAALNTVGVEIQMKIRIPQYRGIDSMCVCVISEKQYEVYNATHVTNKNGFSETEITLKTPTMDREVIENEEDGTE